MSADDEHEANLPEPSARPVATQSNLYRVRKSAAGSALYAGMLGLEKVLESKPREDIAVVVDAPTQPVDIEADGVAVPAGDGITAYTPPLPRKAPVRGRSRTARGNRRTR